jgi:hypothetical protein
MLVRANCYSYEIFYYLDKPILELRLINCLEKWPGILVNYPPSTDPKEMSIESDLILDYGLKATSESVLADADHALSKKDYYGLVMISASLLGDKLGNEIKKDFVKFAKNRLSDDKYSNSILAFCITTLVNKGFLLTNNFLERDRMSILYNFILDLRIKGFDSKQYSSLEEIDNKIMENCFSEIIR